ncbi:MAG: hypothetical protein JO246_02215 [Frankiaceae bacterium]|nr:hypothetical protein [Frankiaceae bacterium]MBV9872878.1 hypothetical protein [Frankiaceae bacterium]
MRRTPLLSAITIGTVLALALPATASGGFSTHPKSQPDPHPNHQTQLWRVRVGNDGGFDRIVFDERFSKSGYDVHYVKHVVSDASGKRIHVKGKYFLSVAFTNTGTDGAAGTPTDVHKKYTPLLPEIRQIKKTGEFEGVVSFGIGLKHRRDFRVENLTHPHRVVIDVKH